MNIREEITNDIVKAIAAGTPPWRKGWVSRQPHFNASSGQIYKGINQILTGMQGHTDPRWLTFKQADYMGLRVRPREKGTRIVRMVELSRERIESMTSDTGEVMAEDSRAALVMKSYVVFNASQIDGFAAMPEKVSDIKPAEAVQAIISGLQSEAGGRLKVNYAGDQPAYYVRPDEIRIPPPARFHSIEDFHGTILHEAAHASGHPKRMARLHMDGMLTKSELAHEELVAELSSAMLCGIVGLRPGPTMLLSHAAYISSWLDALRRDSNEIFRAAAEAEKVCNYISLLALNASSITVLDGRLGGVLNGIVEGDSVATPIAERPSEAVRAVSRPSK